MSEIKAIPTNVITGFLGVGKTTAISHLLKQKPQNERWAVLINEFGEVGVDGSLLANNESGVYIREVPGGCMCCAAGLPMQIALNQLVNKAKPHRLLIEPTGLGHPKEVLSILSADYNRDLLDLKATITLIDARKIKDSRYTENPTFIQQLSVADVIGANKCDLYSTSDFPNLLAFLESSNLLENKSVFQLSNGALDLDWLNSPAQQRQTYHSHSHSDFNRDLVSNDHTTFIENIEEIPDRGYLSVENTGEGFFSRGWIFSPTWIFDTQKLINYLSAIDAERIKAVFICDDGVHSFNKADNVITHTLLDDCLNSRLECISTSRHTLSSIESAILQCVINT